MYQIKNVIVISDTHFGCKFGLFPDKFILDENNVVLPSKLQKVVYGWWQEFWGEWVPMVTKHEPYIIVHNGDAVDGDHHGSKTQITKNITDQIKIAEQVMKPVVSKAEKYYHIRGTEAHVGKSGEFEEMLAKNLNAVPDEFGNHARWEMYMKLQNSLIHFSHHIGTSQSTAYESTAVYKELVESFNEAGRWRDTPPDVVVRSHRHRQFEIRVATERGYGIPLVTPGWQLKTPFVYRLASGRSGTPQIGGYLIRHGDEDEVYTRFKVWKIKRTQEEII